MLRKVLILVFVPLFWSCSVEDVDLQDSKKVISESGIRSLVIPRDFNFSTTNEVNVNVAVKSIHGIPLSGIKVSFFTANPDFGGEFLASVFTNSSGDISTPVLVPTYLEEIFVQVHSPGFANQISKSISPNMNFSFGGIPEERALAKNDGKDLSRISISDEYYYMGSFSYGAKAALPDYLEDEGDILSQSFLNTVAASLPDQSVPVFNPDYLTTGNELDIVVNSQSDVWITFVSEGAGYRNALGYYVFDSGNPPSSSSEIDSVFVILPNASLSNSGGKLNAGDKVKLGTFPAGKTISWVLFQNAWKNNRIDVDATKFYSRIDFNTMESDASKRQHTVQLADFGNELLINGFEDQTRSVSSDDDFNDLIFYVTANPWEGITTGGIPPATVDGDTDGDGIIDGDDDFPDDPLRATRNTYTGSLAYEDLWPAEGDYDFNDLVMDYEIDHILNASNLLVDIETDWTIRGVFASFSNGFGIQFDNLSSSDVSSVSGTMLNNNLITLNSNGTEANQSKVSIIFYDNVFDVVESSGSSFPHTYPVSTMNNVINFSNPVSQTVSGFPPL